MPSTTLAECAGQPCSASTVSSPFRNPQTSMTSEPELRPERIERCVKPLTRRDHDVADMHAAITKRGTVDRIRPVRGDARLQAGNREIGAEALACGERGGVEHGAAVAVFAPCEPGERALRLVALYRTVRLEQRLLKLPMLRLEFIQRRRGFRAGLLRGRAR